MSVNEIARTQRIIERAIQPALIQHQQMVQELVERAIQPVLIEQQQMIERAMKPLVVQAAIDRQELVERVSWPAVVQSQNLVNAIAEQAILPALLRNQRIIEQAIEPAIRYQCLVEQMLPAIDTAVLADDLLETPEIEGMVADFEEATRRSTPSHSVEPTASTSVDWGLTHSVGFFITTASYMVDCAIEERGLSEAISEVKRLKWVLELVLTLLAITYYSNKLLR